VIRLFADHPTAAFLLALACLAIGLLALPGLQRDTFPDFRADRIEVRVVYPGAAANEVETTICLPVEDALEATAGVNELACTARENVAIATVEVERSADTARTITDIKTEIDAIDTFPEEVETPVVRELEIRERVISIAVTGVAAETALRSLAEDLKTRLSRLPLVAEVEVTGFSERQYEIALEEQPMRALDLSASDVAAIIERQSLDLPSGTIATRDREILVRFVDQRRTIEGLANLIVREEPGGGSILLGDIATISERFTEEEDRLTFNGERAARLDVMRTKDVDALRVLDAVEAFVAEERAALPQGIELVLTNDVTTLIADRLRLLLENAAMGFGLVFLVLWAFFSIRFSLAVALALPLSFLVSLFAMQLLGLKIDMLSMVGLLISIGLVIDSAIVITENVASHINRGEPRLEATVAGVREVAAGVVSSFLTSIAVFGPLAFLAGDIGMVLRVIPIVLIITLAASLVVSFLILPRLVGLAVTGRSAGRLRRALDNGFEQLRDRVVAGLVDLSVRFRYLTLGLVSLLMAASLAMLVGGVLKFQAFPDIEGDVAEARLMMTQGTPLARTEATVRRLLEGLEAAEAELAPEGGLVENVAVQWSANRDFQDRGPHLATVTADLKGTEERDVHLETFLAAWREATGTLPDIVALSFTEPALGPAGRPIELRLQGEELDDLEAASSALMAELDRYAGVADIARDLHPGKPELRVRLRDGAGRLGIDAETIAGQLRTALEGRTVDEFHRRGEQVVIDVRHNEVWRESLRQIDDFVVVTTEGRQVPLDVVAEVAEGRGQALIPRIDGRRTVTVQADVDTDIANTNEILGDLEASFFPGLPGRFDGVRAELEGQAAAQAETAGSLRRGLLLGLLGMFVILSFQFKSYIEPLIVMVAIPLALIGVVGGHWLLGLELSMPSMVGFASLAGIVVNNSILLVIFIKLRQARGEPIAASAKAASLDRFRPIFMTSSTTIAGLVPLLFETSTQAQVLVPLVASLAFGLFSATVLILFLIPALYVILDDLRPAARPASAAAGAPR